MSEAPSRARGPSLVALLAVALFVELWLNRIVARVLRADPVRHLTRAARVVDGLAFFSQRFTSVLGALLLLAAVVYLARSSRYRPPQRAAIAVSLGGAALLCAAGVLTRLPPKLGADLYLSAMFALVVLALGALTLLHAAWRLRLGLALYVVPPGLMLAAILLQQMSPPGVLDPDASALAERASYALVVVGLAAPFLLGPRGAPSPLGVTLSAIVLGCGLALGHLDWDASTRLAAIGLGVTVPIAPWALPIYVLGAASMAYTIGALLARPGPERLRGVGLLLAGSVSLQLEVPYQIACALLGVVCLLDSLARPARGAISREELDAHLRRWAARVGSAQVTVVGAPGHERARIGFTFDASTPGVLALDRRDGAIDRVELSVGEVPARRPPFTFVTRGRRGLGPEAPGPVIATDDRDFDARFVVRDHRGAGTALLDAETRARVGRLVDGLVGVWPQRGARFVGVAPPPDDDLPSLVGLLGELTRRAGA